MIDVADAKFYRHSQRPGPSCLLWDLQHGGFVLEQGGSLKWVCLLIYVLIFERQRRRDGEKDLHPLFHPPDGHNTTQGPLEAGNSTCSPTWVQGPRPGTGTD